jgi:23S rRNA pseudouridine1911/1915/1917 synthase
MEQKGLIPSSSSYSFTVPTDTPPTRADKFIAHQFTDYSRSFLHKLFEQGQVTIDSHSPIKASHTIKPGQTIFVSFKPQELVPKKDIPLHIGVSILAQEQDFYIISKPAGIIVHKPTHQSQEVTLADWIADQHEEIAHVGAIDRPGIVHRLDKDTSGLMIIPRTNKAHGIFTELFKNREIHKTYIALVDGHTQVSGTIQYSIGRHPGARHKMTHFPEYSQESFIRSAQTHYETLTYFDNHSLVMAKPVTGRTHQIRVHFQAIKHPLVGDALYGAHSKLINRHALHAYSIEFMFEGKQYAFTCPLADDMITAIQTLEKQSKHTVKQKEFTF